VHSGTKEQDTVYLVRFVLVAPNAKSVSLVGDFNNWNKTMTRLTPVGSSGAWATVVPLSSDRHEYAFIVDGTKWVADPTAPTTIQDDFGTTSSLITVGTRTG
jgi:1,4-alpha-glucan branching enzyme